MGRRALVAGAGIGGLAVARALRETGFEVEIFERAPDLVPSGAGISLWPNATHVLQRLGVTDALPDSRSFPTSALRRWDGSVIISKDLTSLEGRYGASLLFLQRATLHNALLSGGIRELVRTDAEVVGASESATGVQAKLHTGEKVEADLLIGADGIRSKVRTSLLNDGPPRHCGLLAYRALTTPPAFEFSVGEFLGPGRVFGLVPVDGNRLFWLATKRAPAGEPPEANPIPALLERHRGWAPEILEIIGNTDPEEVMRHDLFDRKPSKRWVGKRVALLGDAAHPMLPFLGQGACQALVDAEVLGKAVRTSTDIPSALQKYQEQRAHHVASVTRQSRNMGLAMHMRAAPARAVRDRLIGLLPERLQTRQIDNILDLF